MTVNSLSNRRAAPAQGDDTTPAAAAVEPVAATAAAQPRPGANRTSRLLLVEDDQLLASLLTRVLEGAGFTVYVTAYGEDALDLAKMWRFDAVLLDLTLADIPGQAVLRQLRASGSHEPPVIILSGDSALRTKLEGFEVGADDFMVKPFDSEELLARVGAVIRRARSHMPAEIRVGELVLDAQARRARVGETILPLTGKEYQCLEFLALRRGSTVTKEMFLAHLYGGREEPEMKIIDVFICKIRRKLAEAGAPPVIETVWGRGYTIASDD